MSLFRRDPLPPTAEELILNAQRILREILSVTIRNRHDMSLHHGWIYSQVQTDDLIGKPTRELLSEIDRRLNRALSRITIAPDTE